MQKKKTIYPLDEFILSLSLDAIPNNQTYTGTIFHYTSLKNINSILFNTDKTAVLWASRFDCLNDISEGKVLEKVYILTCQKLLEENLISDETFKLFSSIVPSRNETYLTPINTENIKSERLEFDTYIISFSKSRDLLSMWNYYSKGNMYEGMNIGFDAEALKKSITEFLPKGKVKCEVCSVIYEQLEQEKILRNFLLEINKKKSCAKSDSVIRAAISMKLTSLNMLFKDSHFKHEEEVRVILKISKKYKNDFDINYRNYAGLIIPYIPIKVDNTTVSHITLGPIIGDENQKQLQKNILHEMLIANNYQVNEEISSIPVRY